MPTQFSLNCAGWPCLRWLSGYCRRSAHRVSSSVLWLHFYQGRCREVHCFHQRVFCGTGALLLPVFLLPGSQFHFKWCRTLCCSRWGMHYRRSLIQMMQVRLYHLSWRVATNGLTFAHIPPCWVNMYILKWDWEFIEIITWQSHLCTSWKLHTSFLVCNHPFDSAMSFQYISTVLMYIQYVSTVLMYIQYVLMYIQYVSTYLIYNY